MEEIKLNNHKQRFIVKPNGDIEQIRDLSNEDFFDWLACAVVDSDWKESNEFYREVICRKLVRLGVLILKDDMYILPDPKKD